MASSTIGTRVTEVLRPLPILMPGGGLPEGSALARLRAAKLATGYQGLVIPSIAVAGSPGPVLAIGVEPDWLVEYAFIPNLNDVTRIAAALTAILITENDPRLGTEVDLLSKWFGKPVKLIGTEDVS
jgi:hypothetical protein